MANIYKQKLEQQQKENELKKSLNKKKRLTIISAACAGALALVILIFALVPLRPTSHFSTNGYVSPHRFEVYKSGKLENWTKSESPSLYNGLEKGLKDMGFSVLRGILEGKLSAGLRIEKEFEDREEPNKLTNPIEKGELNDLASYSTEDKFLLVLVYTSEQSVRIDSTTINYNRIAMYVATDGNKITENQIYFYNSSVIDEEDYHTFHTYFNGNLENLFNFINDNSIA